MADPASPLALAERVTEAARGLGIESALIGAGALAVHNYIRGTQDIDLATMADPQTQLMSLAQTLRELGLHVELRMPDEDDVLGGVLQVWEHEGDDGMPLEPVDVVNFLNPYRPRLTPAADAIKHATRLDELSALRCVRLPDLIALKLYAGSRRDLADVVELLARNSNADREEIRATCQRYGFSDTIDELIAEAADQVR